MLKQFYEMFFTKIQILFIICIILFHSQTISAQSGSIYGKVADAGNGEVLIGANVLVVGTNYGASTDIDGKYAIKGLESGRYTIRVSYISYTTVTVENVIVKTGENTELNLTLETSSTELEEVVVTAEALKNTEANILKIQKTSANIVDGLSSELIKKNNSSDGTDVLKRMTGVTISDGKYAFVRGVGDRYNNTLLNGANLPSTDPEKKSFSYDIFPAGLIENVITSKTFTPDKPADFSGGLVQINTIEFPNKFTLDISTTSGFNKGTTFKSFDSYSGGGKDYLAYDDGTRKYPNLISDNRVVRGNYTDDQISEITKSFKNNWSITNSNAPINSSFKISVGDNYSFGNDVLGYVASLNYSNGFENSTKEKNFYDFAGPRYTYTGENYSKNVMLGGLLNISYKLSSTNKFSFKNVFNQNADDETIKYKGDYRYAGQYREITSLRFVSRSLRSHQLVGEHFVGLLNGLNIDWGLSLSRSDRNEPDGRRYVYSRALDDPETEPLRFLLDQSLATRFYGTLVDNDFGLNTNFNFKLFDDNSLPKIKVGLLYNKKDRNFDARIFGFRNGARGNFALEDSVLQLSIDRIFQPENINPTFINVTEITKPSDSYDSNQKIAAGYLMFDATVFDQFRVVSGVRFEYSNQNLSSFTLTGEAVEVKNYYRDWLPSINVTYLINPEMNLRLGYSTTLARPEFREIAPFTYFDFLSNELVQGNTDLKRALINNFDIRYEMFPGAGELVAVSMFYKRFINPIELILIASSGNEAIRSFANAESANNYGLEFEIRKNLNFISDIMNNFSIVGNATLIKSKIKLNNAGSNTFQKNDRPLQGLAEYVFNLGLYYDNLDLGFNTSIIYNKVGSRIARVGVNDLGDIIEKPVDLIDFNISKKIFDKFTIKFSAKDLLNQDRLFIQQTTEGDRVSDLVKTGRSFSLGLAYQL